MWALYIRNKLVSLPNGIFDGLTNLTEKNLVRNFFSVKLVRPSNISFGRLTNLLLFMYIPVKLVRPSNIPFGRLTNLLLTKNITVKLVRLSNIPF